MGCGKSTAISNVKSNNINGIQHGNNLQKGNSTPQFSNLINVNRNQKILPKVINSYLSTDNFDYLKVLGVGGFGTVLLCKNKETRQEYAAIVKR